MSDLVLALAKIQKEVVAPRDKQKNGIKFKYRNAEQVLAAVKPLLGDCIILLSDEVVAVGTRFYVKATATIRLGNDEISVSALAREDEKRPAMCDSQVTGSTSSYARKYALGGLLLLDDETDPDSISNNNQSKKVDYDAEIKKYWAQPEGNRNKYWSTLSADVQKAILDNNNG